MKCLAIERLAAHAAGEHAEAVIDHVALCARCRELLDDQLAIRDLVRRAPVPRAADADRRAVLAAEILAAADAPRAPARSHLRIAIAIGVAAAAAAVIVILARGRDASVAETRTPATPDKQMSADRSPAAPDKQMSADRTPATPDMHMSETRTPARPDKQPADRTPARPDMHMSETRTPPSPDKQPTNQTPTSPDKQPADRTPARPDKQPADRSPATPDKQPADRSPASPDKNRAPDKPVAPATANELASVSGTLGVDFARDTNATRDLVTLRDGQLAVDATSGRRSVRIVVGGARVEIAGARVAVAARRGAIESITVFAGAVEIAVGDRTQRIEPGMVWEPAADALRAFREGWTALRTGKHADALAAFDRAVALDRADAPVVAEDAAYWAAIASERAGTRADAVKRYEAFLARFPRSPRADAARASLRRR